MMLGFKHENSENWLCQLPKGVYQQLLPFIGNAAYLRASCTFFARNIQVSKFSDIDFKSKAPKSELYLLPEFKKASSAVRVSALQDGRFIVLRSDNFISVIAPCDDQSKTLRKQMSLHRENKAEYVYQTPFAFSELPNNNLLLCSGQEILCWNIAPCAKFETRKPIQVKKLDDATIKCHQLLPNGNIALGLRQKKVLILDLATLTVEKEFVTKGSVRDFGINFSGNLVVIYGKDQHKIVSINLKDGSMSKLIILDKRLPITKSALYKTLIRDNAVYAEAYVHQGTHTENVEVSERANGYSYILSTNHLGVYHSHISDDGQIVRWNRTDDQKGMRIEVTDYPRTAVEFRFKV